MGQINDWFCANCLRAIDQLSRHGRCPYCDSIAVDVASRRSLRYSERASSASGYHDNTHAGVVTSMRPMLAA